MKPTAYLVNTSRDALIDEVALVRAVAEEGWIAAAALDVAAIEPLEASFAGREALDHHGR